ncbi:hypothetical protein PR048_002408 [Dryococelus australis]|uniref:Uncharacterized protein n=1 Tax=Dryococelus australis TaxID=614101 RepID=A0ABQ9IK43_9NEOP|nr:hypothetical protein PR048_002408 [Dryococelus australis]
MSAWIFQRVCCACCVSAAVGCPSTPVRSHLVLSCVLLVFLVSRLGPAQRRNTTTHGMTLIVRWVCLLKVPVYLEFLSAFEAERCTTAKDDIATCIKFNRQNHGEGVMTALISNHSDTGSIPCGVALRFSHVGNVPDDAAGRSLFSGISRFPLSCFPALLHTHLATPSSPLKIPKLRTSQTSLLRSKGPLLAWPPMIQLMSRASHTSYNLPETAPINYSAFEYRAIKMDSFPVIESTIEQNTEGQVPRESRRYGCFRLASSVEDFQVAHTAQPHSSYQITQIMHIFMQFQVALKVDMQNANAKTQASNAQQIADLKADMQASIDGVKQADLEMFIENVESELKSSSLHLDNRWYQAEKTHHTDKQQFEDDIVRLEGHRTNVHATMDTYKEKLRNATSLVSSIQFSDMQHGEVPITLTAPAIIPNAASLPTTSHGRTAPQASMQVSTFLHRPSKLWVQQVLRFEGRMGKNPINFLTRFEEYANIFSLTDSDMLKCLSLHSRNTTDPVLSPTPNSKKILHPISGAEKYELIRDRNCTEKKIIPGKGKNLRPDRSHAKAREWQQLGQGNEYRSQPLYSDLATPYQRQQSRYGHNPLIQHFTTEPYSSVRQRSRRSNFRQYHGQHYKAWWRNQRGDRWRRHHRRESDSEYQQSDPAASNKPRDQRRRRIDQPGALKAETASLPKVQ